MDTVRRAIRLFGLRLHIWRTVKDILVLGAGRSTLGFEPSYMLHPGNSSCLLACYNNLHLVEESKWYQLLLTTYQYEYFFMC